jgi:hypothetical protein
MSGSRGLELVIAQSPFIVPLRRDPPPARSHDRVSGWEGNMGRSDSRAQRAGMIPRLSSQNFIRLRKLNDFRRRWVGKSISFLTWMTF